MPGRGWRDATSADLDEVRSPRWGVFAEASALSGALVPAGACDAVDDRAPDDDPLTPEEAHGNLRRYARWQWRDFWVRRGGWLTLGALLGLWLLTYLAWHGNGPRGDPLPPENVVGMAHVFFSLGGVLAALLGVGGLVSRERERGLQRFLFAKPVQPVRYYLQALGINSLGALLVLGGAVLLAAAILGGALVPVKTVLAMSVAAYILTAGATFLLSTLVRFDAPIAAAWLVMGFPVAGLASAGWYPAKLAVVLFPQGPLLAFLEWGSRTRGQDEFTLILSMLAWLILVPVTYGLLATAGGIAVLRRRAVST